MVAELLPAVVKAAPLFKGNFNAAAGVVNLYSRDFYQLAAKRLEKHGLVAQWLPPLILNADTAFIERMNTHRQRLMQFYRASLNAYDGDRAAWGRDIREVMRGDGGNPYYRWFVGD
ncbi:hypothetical protein PS723_05921 [Pseudomonas fluorescens]|uniref:Uncharacterized protein n=1 Tax=Pseudomonas fluorescens TaxID=294 RepID=A0A5E7FQZ9_PSEFL|nr:hypothetical protein PS723_05921 [Pseudomonas fluorescens]